MWREHALLLNRRSVPFDEEFVFELNQTGEDTANKLDRCYAKLALFDVRTFSQ